MAMNPHTTQSIRVNRKRGVALLIAVIFMSVVLSLGLALGSLGYKQEILASSAIESQYAFYAADAALECALYADEQQANYTYTDYYGTTNKPNAISCDDSSSVRQGYSIDSTKLVDTERISLDNNTHCADVTIYKYASLQGSGSTAYTTYIFSQGYDVSCTTVAAPGVARFSARGLSIHY